MTFHEHKCRAKGLCERDRRHLAQSMSSADSISLYALKPSLAEQAENERLK